MADGQDSPQPKRPPQLQMLLCEAVIDDPPAVRVPDGYLMRQYRPDDEAEYLRLMHSAGFTGFDGAQVARLLESTLPDGFFVVEHKSTAALVATAFARHRPTELHPFGGELSFVATDPDHRGKGLGTAVSAAVIRRFVEAGYRRIYLLTDDWRLPAIKIYLRLGFEPMQHCEGMAERWDKVLEELGWRQ